MNKFEYYFYNRETDRYTYSPNFKDVYKLYQETDSFEKYLGVHTIDEDGCVMEDDILIEYEEKKSAPKIDNSNFWTKYKAI